MTDGLRFFTREPEHEILGEPLRITLDGLHKDFGLHLVELGEITTQHYLLTANLPREIVLQSVLDVSLPPCGFEILLSP